MPADAETFTIPRALVRSTRVSTWFFGALALLSAALPVIPDSDGSGSDVAIYVLSVVGVLFFGGFSVMGFRTLAVIRTSAVTIDDDGLWPTHEPKERALVRWDAIRSLEGRRFLQRLDILDESGNPLMKLEYQLSDFGTLRAVILERMKRHCTRPHLPATFKKPVSYHANSIAGAVAFALAGWFVGPTHPLVGYVIAVAVVGFVLYDYTSTVSKLVITSDTITLGYPLSSRDVPLADVASVVMADTHPNNVAKVPEVHLRMKQRSEPVRLRDLGADATTLYLVLSGVVTEGAR